MQEDARREESRVKLHPAQAMKELLDDKILYVRDEISFSTVILRFVEDQLIVYGLFNNSPVRSIMTRAGSFVNFLKVANEVVVIDNENVGDYFKRPDDLPMDIRFLQDDMKVIRENSKVTGDDKNILNVNKGQIKRILNLSE